MKLLTVRPGVFLALAFFFSFAAQAAPCTWNSAKDFFSCDNMGIRQAVGRSLASQLEILSGLPAALPAMPTPVGVEAILSNHTDLGKANRAQVSLIKGFQFLGFGVGTMDVGSFSQGDLGILVANTSFQKAYDSYREDANAVKGMQTGVSIKPPLGPINRLLHLQFGASVGKSKDSSQYSPSYGVSADFHWLSFGYTVSRQILSASLPQVSSTMWNLGLQLDGLYAAMSHSIYHAGGNGLNTTIYSLRWSGPHLNFYVAGKKFIDANRSSRTTFQTTVDGKINEHLSAGYMYGLYNFSHSLFLQLFF